MGAQAVNWFKDVDWRLPNDILAYRFQVSTQKIKSMRCMVRRTLSVTLAEDLRAETLKIGKRRLASLRKIFDLRMGKKQSLVHEIVLEQLRRPLSLSEVLDAVRDDYGTVSERTVARAISDLYTKGQIVYTEDDGQRVYRRVS
jgi:hypothetical protein